MNRSTRFRLVASLAVCGAVAACALDPLNPQPLPPSPEFGADAGILAPPRGDASLGGDNPSESADAAVQSDGGPDDAGTTDASDAGADADASTTADQP